MMLTMQKGALKVAHTEDPEPKSKTDIVWTMNEHEYIVRNVPYTKSAAPGEDFFDVNIAITVTALRDLMHEGKIPSEVDFEEVADIEFDW